MRGRRLPRAFVLLLAVALCAGAQNESQTWRRKIETPHLTLGISTSDSDPSPGERVSLLLDITPRPKMHVYAPEQKDMVPITVTLSQDPAFTVHKPRLPKPETYFFEPLQETHFVFSRPFRIVQDVTLADTTALRKRAASGDPLEISGKVRYQACDDKVCYMPQDVTVVWRIKLVAR